MQDIIVAIDGYSGCGKSSTAKEVARFLGYVYLDSGAMYRAVTLFFLRENVDISSSDAVCDALNKINIHFERNNDTHENETYLNGENVESEIRKMEVSDFVSDVSALPAVRLKMVEQQRRMGGNKRVVMDGRDIGTNVFPEAELKVFMTADLKVRAHRRKIELQQKGVDAALEEIQKNLAERDRLDTQRSENPLIQAKDAIVIDTTFLEFAEQVDQITRLATKLIKD
jgi:cytidylate kinase